MPGPNSAFDINAEDLRLAGTPALEVNAGGLRVKIDSHVERVAGGLRLATGARDNTAGITGGGASPLSLVLDTAMEFAAGALRAKTKAAEGLGKDANGYFVDKTQGFTWTGQHAFNGAASTFQNVPASSADPVGGNDLARKSYVDGAINVAKYNFDVKDSARLGTIAALPAFTRSVVGGVTRLTANANGALTVDSLNANNGDRVGVLKETGGNKKWNGLYVVTDKGSAGTPWVLDRSADADAAAEFGPGLFFSIDEGVTIASSRWVMNTAAPFTLDTTDASFARFDAGTIQAGAGLTRTGDSIDFVAADDSLTVNADSVQAKLDGLGGLMVQAGQGLKLKIAGGNPGLALDGGGNVDTKRSANNGIGVDAGGLLVQRDVTTNGQLSTTANGVRVAAGGVGLPVKGVVEDYAAATFTYNGGTNLSTHAVAGGPISSHANAIDQGQLLKSGIDNMKRVAGAPAAAGEWRYNGTNIDIYGDVTASGDTYRLRFLVDV